MGSLYIENCHCNTMDQFKLDCQICIAFKFCLNCVCKSFSTLPNDRNTMNLKSMFFFLFFFFFFWGGGGKLFTFNL